MTSERDSEPPEVDEEVTDEPASGDSDGAISGDADADVSGDAEVVVSGDAEVVEVEGTPAERGLRRTLLAGVTLGVMLVPQGMAYAMIAGLPPVYGLYASIVPLLVYPLLSTSRHVAFGIVALDMLVVSAALARMAPESQGEAIGIALTLAAMVGLIHIALGAARLGFLVEFMSRPVIAGFVTAAPILIALTQVPALLGSGGERSQNVFVLIHEAYQATRLIDLPSLILSLVAIVALGSFKRWLPSFPRALVVIGAATVIVSFVSPLEAVERIGHIDKGFPAVWHPILDPFTWYALLPSALTLAVVQIMTLFALGKQLALEHGYRIQTSTELMALGAANLAGSVSGAPPVSASFSRTAINAQAGGSTAWVNGVAASVVAMSLAGAADILELIPKAALAALIVVAVLPMVRLRELQRLFRLDWREGTIAVLTALSTLTLGIVDGVLYGVVTTLVLRLYKDSRPRVAVLERLPGTSDFRDRERHARAEPVEGVLVIRVDGSLTFASIERVRHLILEHLEGESTVESVVLDARGINEVDTTGIAGLDALVDALELKDVAFFVVHLKGRAREMFQKAGLDERLGRDAFARSTGEAVVRAAPTPPDSLH